MARILATIRPVHADGSVCKHKVTSKGVPRESGSGCTGRTGFTADCSACEWTDSGSTGTALEYSRDSHLRDHAAGRVCDFCGKTKTDVTRRQDPLFVLSPQDVWICDDCTPAGTRTADR